MKRFALAAIFAFALAACETMPVSGVAMPSGPSTIPSGPVDLGNWRNASEAATLQAFQQSITSRYGAGLQVSNAAADLRRNEFSCGAAPPLNQGRGDPPAQVCRRTITASGCTHTWQVHLFDESGNSRLARTRGLYDRRCGGDGLLGGPS
jgi:hypothetical protein